MSKKVGIWGLGTVGKAALPYFSSRGFALEVMDKRTPNIQEQALLHTYNAPFFPQDCIDNFLERNEYILASCTIDLRPYRRYSHKWLSELDLFFDECTKPIIAITGSVGKTSVTHLLSALLKGNGYKVFTGGNIGIGLLDSITAANQADYIVLEISSFQLEHCKRFAPHIALCTNIYPNHLDRHSSLQEYIDAKLKIMAYQKKSDWALFPLQASHLIPPSLQKCNISLFASNVFLSDGYDRSYPLYFLHNEEILRRYQTNNEIIFAGSPFPNQSYPENILLLLSCLHLLGLPLNTAFFILQSTILPLHRLEKVATHHQIDFYNDSKSTLPIATLAAVKKLNTNNLILLLGGISKGVQRHTLIQELKGAVRFIFCFGKEAQELHQFCQTAQIPSYACSTLTEVFENLSRYTMQGDTVLLSPAGASYDLYKDYQERGEHFKQLVSAFINQ